MKFEKRMSDRVQPIQSNFGTLKEIANVSNLTICFKYYSTYRLDGNLFITKMFYFLASKIYTPSLIVFGVRNFIFTVFL